MLLALATVFSLSACVANTPGSTQNTTAPTEPLTPMEELELFALEHDLTLADYPEKILELYERNPEAREFCMNYPLEYGKEHEIDISGYADYEGVPLFIQWDKQWGYKDYIGSVGGLSACGPTSLSMIMYYFTRDPEMTPAYMMEFAEKNGNEALHAELQKIDPESAAAIHPTTPTISSGFFFFNALNLPSKFFFTEIFNLALFPGAIVLFESETSTA